MIAAPDANPDAVPGMPPPTVHRIDVGDAELHVETRGSGRPILIIGAADEDAEVYRGMAERLARTNTVVTYDRRGTGRSDIEGWPTDSRRHADDAASIIGYLGLSDVCVFGASAGALVALRLALRTPQPLQTVVCFEPGAFGVVAGGAAIRRRVEAAVAAHLNDNPGDFPGASDALGRVAAEGSNLSSLFTPSVGMEWYSARTGSHAEALIRGDLPLTGESFDHVAIADCQLNLRFAHGTASLPIFGEITERLAALRGETPDTLPGVGHLIFYHPEAAVEYLRPFG